MPIGLLGAFMILDKLSTMDEDDQLREAQAHELHAREGQTVQDVYMAALRQKLESEKKASSLSCSRPVDGLLPGNDQRKCKKGKDGAVMLDGKRSERLNGPVLLSKAQQDVGKIVKQKMALESHLEKISREQDFSTLCRVSAQIDLL